MRWQNFQLELVRLGVPMDGASLDNPTDGIVWIPASALRDVNRVAIQPNERRRPEAVPLRGFEGLHDIARDMGCAPESRFVR